MKEPSKASWRSSPWPTRHFASCTSTRTRRRKSCSRSPPRQPSTPIRRRASSHLSLRASTSNCTKRRSNSKTRKWTNSFRVAQDSCQLHRWPTLASTALPEINTQIRTVSFNWTRQICAASKVVRSSRGRSQQRTWKPDRWMPYRRQARRTCRSWTSSAWTKSWTSSITMLTKLSKCRTLWRSRRCVWIFKSRSKCEKPQTISSLQILSRRKHKSIAISSRNLAKSAQLTLQTL